VHAKYLAVDGARGWIGTSNWEKDYFHASRNLGVTFESARLAGILDAFFDGNWSSPYAEPVRAEVAYTAPRTRE
jgi:phosphatidylserine/phosphatidylglycerophosphate/cardiolipin synthase-like enzyme